MKCYYCLCHKNWSPFLARKWHQICVDETEGEEKRLLIPLFFCGSVNFGVAPAPQEAFIVSTVLCLDKKCQLTSLSLQWRVDMARLAENMDRPEKRDELRLCSDE